MNARVKHLALDRAVAADMLERLAAPYLAAGDAGAFEIVGIWPDRSARRAPEARHVSLADLASAVHFAAEVNVAGFNVYVGAGLRSGAPAHARASDTHVAATRWLWLDFDDEGAAEAGLAKLREAALGPTMMIATGRTPWLRRQCWWRLAEPMDGETARTLMKRMVAGTGADPTPTNPSRVMRLAGSVGWPKPDKPGRIPEIVEIEAAGEHGFAEIGRQADRLEPPYAAGARAATAESALDFNSAPRQGGGFGFDAGSEASRAEAEEIVGHIDPDCGYDEWVRVLMGLHDRFGGSTEGFEIADAWSARGSKYTPGEVAAKWRTFTPGGGAGWPTVCEIARRHGGDLSEIAKRHRGGSPRVHVGRSYSGGRGGDAPPGSGAATLDGAERPDSAEEIDLSHDALACDLGRRGWDRDAKHVAAWGRWLFWTGARWETDDRLANLTQVRVFLRARAEDLVGWAERKAAATEAEKGEGAGDKLRSWAKTEARTLRSKTTVAAVEHLARANPASVAAPDDFDADRMLLGTPGGVVDLRTGTLRPARREDMMTRCTKVAPERGRPELWLRFLDEIFEGDAEVIGFMQRAAGYALTGMTTEHKLLFLYGTGRNGKSTFVNTLFDLWGDYARRASATTFLNTGLEKHPTDLAGLRGARLVAASELPKGRSWDESVIKDLTGGDVMTARFMRGDFFDFDPHLTLMIAGNTMPSFRGVDEAIRARVVLVPFEVTLAPERRDRDLPAKLAAEGGRILQWAIEGAVTWGEGGLAVPGRLADASAEYFDDEDMLGQFLADETEADPGGFVTTSALHDRFGAWCTRQGLSVWTLMTMQKEMKSRGFEAERRHFGRGFKDLKLNPSWVSG